RPREVVHVLSDKPHSAKSRRHVDVRRRRRIIRVACEPQLATLLHALPAGITGDGNAGGHHDLILRQHHRHVVRAVLAVQLTSRYERIRLPPGEIIHGHLWVPLREVPRAAATPLPTWYRYWSRVPLE